jgi:uncharacterized membrane protein YfcA
VLLGLAATPLVYVGTAVGMRVARYVDQELMRRLALGTLALIAAVAILQPLIVR